MPYMHVITDSFDVFGYRENASKKAITCSTELQSMVEGTVWLKTISTCV